MEKLILKLTRVNEDGERVICEEEMDSVAIIGDCYDSNKIMEMISRVSIKRIAEMIVQSEHFMKAARVAVMSDHMARKLLKVLTNEDPEQDLIDQIEGGLQ